jgi:HD-GYP domain-containing protein (c-di-GMP phosphodiesterase class II)
MTHTKEYKIVTHRMDLLLEVGQAINSVLDVDKLLSLIAEKTAELLDSDRCSIFVVDADKDIIWTQAATGTGRIEISRTTGIAGAVATSGAIINVPDAYADPRFNKDIDRQTGYQTRNILAGPMFNQEREIIGVFQLINSNRGKFTRPDERILKALSGFAGNALEKSLLYEELKTTFLSVLEVLAATIDAKHPYTAGHTHRVAEYSCGIGEEMGLSDDEMEELKVAAYLHDYGKIGIRDAVLTKPGRLTNEEYTEIQSHVVKTQEILTHMHFARNQRNVPAIAGSHHERWDGRGYPNKLSENDIPIGARIMAIADVFDALTSDRDYREALPKRKVLDMLRSDIGTAFDPQVFPYFEKYFERRFPDD